ncbi:MAG: extracellular solute-binding protein [Planctomycetota bacterium]|nr:MAG: extracellular solute-binding protein [Planctomycetota bacterium]
MSLLWKRLKTVFAAALALLAGSLVLAAFVWVLSRPWRLSSSASGQVELTLMHWSGEGGSEEDAIVGAVLADFEAQHPGVRVRRINPGDGGSFYTKLQTMMAAGTPPDLFYVGAERFPAFVEAGLLAPLDQFLEQDRDQNHPQTLPLEDFYPAPLSAFRFDGQQTGTGQLYGIPKDFTTFGFFYNRDLFAQAGLSEPEMGWTWQDFLVAARAIGALPGCTGAEFVTWPSVLRLYLRTEGVDVSAEQFQRSRLREPEVYAALERLRNWRHQETSTLTSGKSKVATGASVFLTGKVGMAGPFGHWVVPSYRKIESFAWDFAPMPRGRVQANAVATVAWAVSSQSPHPEEAWALVRHLCGPRSQALAAPMGLAVPTLRSVAESEAFLGDQRPPRNSRVFLQQAEYAEVLPWPANPVFEDRLGKRMDQALKTGDLNLDEAISLFEKEWHRASSSPLQAEGFAPVPWRALVSAALGFLLLLISFLGWQWWRGRPGRLERREELAGYALVSPWLIGFLVFMAFPIFLSLVLSFSRWNGVSTLEHADWVGLANFQELLLFDDRLRTSLRVTAYYAFLAVPLGQLAALATALLMSREIRGIGFFRSAWYLPSVLAGVGVAVLWRWVFDGDHGLLNGWLRPMLQPFGLEPPQWLDQDAAGWGPPAFALMSLWMTGGSMVIYLAGIKGIPKELYEAAQIDGSGAWRRFRSVTLPMLSPVIFFNLIMAIIGSFQVFTQAFVMTGGEPGDLTRFYVLYLYNQAFEYYEMGYASAMAWLLLVVILLLTLLVMRGSRRHVYYEALNG